MNTLEQLVRQLEREVSALESRVCAGCSSRADASGAQQNAHAHAQAQAPAHAHGDSASDTESVADAAHVNAQLQLLKEQLERAEAQLQVRF